MADGMHCSHCLSSAARFRPLKSHDWWLAPLALPVKCQRCLTSYYYPTFLIPIRAAVMAIGRTVERFAPKRNKRNRRHSSVERDAPSETVR
ncbi:MAG TPA: hypothetical protein VG713_10350 [Pirellulales bacterium]|nr:hypothetical protein [Pirellulales bacterium]